MEHENKHRVVRLMSRDEFLGLIPKTTIIVVDRSPEWGEPKERVIRLARWQLAKGSHIIISYKENDSQDLKSCDLEDLRKWASTATFTNRSSSFVDSCRRYEELN